MGILDKLKVVVYRADLFSSNTTLRMRGEPNYESICGGMVSLIIIIAFGSIFFGTFIEVITKATVNSKTQSSENLDTSEVFSEFFFAIGVDSQDFSSGLEDFQFSAKKFSKNNY